MHLTAAADVSAGVGPSASSRSWFPAAWALTTEPIKLWGVWYFGTTFDFGCRVL